MDLKNHISAAVEEIFASMVMMDVERSDDHLDVEKLRNTITSSVGLTGVRRGLLAIHFPIEVALAITSSFLMMDVTEINEDVEDAIGELANMVGGDFKSFLSEKGGDIDLSIPTTITGASYDFRSIAQTSRCLMSFSVAAGIFSVDCQLQK
ncbi:MAG: chemotaxis protein CheX [Desulfotalea sp.]